MSTLKVNKIENTATTDGGLSIDSSGNVGVGTSSPSQLLDINGNLTISSLGDIAGRTFTSSDVVVSDRSGTSVCFSARSSGTNKALIRADGSADFTEVKAPNTAKAWVNFNGSGTVAIRDSFNVSSITDNGTGNYTVNFTTNLANANFAVAVSGCDSTESEPPTNVGFAVKDFTVSNVEVFMRRGNSMFDTDINTVIVFGD